MTVKIVKKTSSEPQSAKVQIPSPYQLAVYNFLQNGTGNLVISAVAGSGKTTTIVNCLTFIPKECSTIFLAFNKSIVTELAGKVPSHVEVSTLHSLGWKAILRSFTKKPKLNENKIMDLAKLLKDQWQNQNELNGGGDIDWDYLYRVKKLVDLLRIELVTSENELDELATKHGVDIVNGEIKRAFELHNIASKKKDEYDFTDMLYVAATNDKVILDQRDFVIVDECQDLNKAQQALLKKIMHSTTRFIAVGDPRQAIYGFAGADVDSFRNLINWPNTTVLPLSVNYRCGKNIVEFAKKYCPQLEAFEGSIDGEVNENGSINDIQDGDMVLCRNTAPLVKCCLMFIAQGKKAYVKGVDIGKNLIVFIKKAKVIKLVQLDEYFTNEVEKLKTAIAAKSPNLTTDELDEHPKVQLLMDKITVVQEIYNDANVQDVFTLIKRIETIFADDKDGICLSTIHKSKGLEEKRVFIIDRYLMPSKYAKKAWQIEQEENLMYVAFTRAKELLSFVTDWTGRRSKNGNKKQAA